MKNISLKAKFQLFALLAFSLILGLGISSKFEFNTLQTATTVLFSIVANFYIAFGYAKEGNKSMAYAISYTSPTTITGDVYEEVMNEILYANQTIDRKLVRFIENVKANIPVKTMSVTVTSQAYSSGAPTSSGTLTPGDKLITPVKQMFYQEFDYETLRGTAHGTDMKAGAFEIVSDMFTQNALALVGPKQGLAMESAFWNGAKAATATAVAALTAGTGQTSVGAAEQTYVAAAPVTLTDGIVTKLIYNTGAVGARYKVAGTTLTASNIKTEIDKVYVQIKPKLLQPANINGLAIYLPYSCMAFINTYNNNPSNFKDAFIPQADGTFKYNGIQIEFVPIPDNCMIAGLKMEFVWAADLLADGMEVKVDKIANNREDYFMKTVYNQESWIFNQSDKVLYLG